MEFEKIKPDEITIQNIPSVTASQIKNIAYNKGISVTALIKPKLRELADSFPKELHKKPTEENMKYFRVRGVSPALVESLYNICDNLGITLSSLLNQELWKVKESYPEQMKKKLDF